MKPDHRSIAIAVTIIVVLLAIFSFKTYVLGAGNTDAARAVLEQKHEQGASAPASVGTQNTPMSTGLRMPGNKH